MTNSKIDIMKQCILCMVASLLLSGCGATIPDLSEEESQIITGYAAGLIIKYNDVTSRYLLNDFQLETAEKKEAAEAEREKKQKEYEAMRLAAQEAEAEGEGEGEESTQQTQNLISSLADVYGMTDFDISYRSYELTKSYPDESRDDYFLAMEATEGKNLCILHFEVTNLSQEEKEFDMFKNQPRFFMSADQEEDIPVQSTLLLDDLSTYKGMLQAGEKTDMVLVFELEDTITAPQSISLLALYGDTEGSLALQ